MYLSVIVFQIHDVNLILTFKGHLIVHQSISQSNFYNANMPSKARLSGAVEDWFNTYPGYLQYMSRCTNVWFMFMIVDVTIDVILPSNWIYVQYIGYES